MDKQDKTSDDDEKNKVFGDLGLGALGKDVDEILSRNQNVTEILRRNRELQGEKVQEQIKSDRELAMQLRQSELEGQQLGVGSSKVDKMVDEDKVVDGKSIKKSSVIDEKDKMVDEDEVVDGNSIKKSPVIDEKDKMSEEIMIDEKPRYPNIKKEDLDIPLIGGSNDFVDGNHDDGTGVKQEVKLEDDIDLTQQVENFQSNAFVYGDLDDNQSSGATGTTPDEETQRLRELEIKRSTVSLYATMRKKGRSFQKLVQLTLDGVTKTKAVLFNTGKVDFCAYLDAIGAKLPSGKERHLRFQYYRSKDRGHYRVVTVNREDALEPEILPTKHIQKRVKVVKEMADFSRIVRGDELPEIIPTINVTFWEWRTILFTERAQNNWIANTHKEKAHCGRDIMMDEARRATITFKGIALRITEYGLACLACTQTSPLTVRALPQVITSKKGFVRSQMDFTFCKSRDPNGVILQMFDHHTKYCVNEYLFSREGKLICAFVRRYAREVARLTGKPIALGIVQVDNEFVGADFVKLVVEEYEGKVIWISAGNAKANGCVERGNQTIKRMADKAYMADPTKSYSDHVMEVTRVYNNTIHSALKVGLASLTPVEAVTLLFPKGTTLYNVTVRKHKLLTEEQLKDPVAWRIISALLSQQIHTKQITRFDSIVMRAEKKRRGNSKAQLDVNDYALVNVNKKRRTRKGEFGLFDYLLRITKKNRNRTYKGVFATKRTPQVSQVKGSDSISFRRNQLKKVSETQIDEYLEKYDLEPLEKEDVGEEEYPELVESDGEDDESSDNGGEEHHGNNGGGKQDGWDNSGGRKDGGDDNSGGRKDGGDDNAGGGGRKDGGDDNSGGGGRRERDSSGSDENEQTSDKREKQKVKKEKKKVKTESDTEQDTGEDDIDELDREKSGSGGEIKVELQDPADLPIPQGMSYEEWTEEQDDIRFAGEDQLILHEIRKTLKNIPSRIAEDPLKTFTRWSDRFFVKKDAYQKGDYCLQRPHRSRLSNKRANKNIKFFEWDYLFRVENDDEGMIAGGYCTARTPRVYEKRGSNTGWIDSIRCVQLEFSAVLQYVKKWTEINPEFMSATLTDESAGSSEESTVAQRYRSQQEVKKMRRDLRKNKEKISRPFKANELLNFGEQKSNIQVKKKKKKTVKKKVNKKELLERGFDDKPIEISSDEFPADVKVISQKLGQKKKVKKENPKDDQGIRIISEVKAKFPRSQRRISKAKKRLNKENTEVEDVKVISKEKVDFKIVEKKIVKKEVKNTGKKEGKVKKPGKKASGSVTRVPKKDFFVPVFSKRSPPVKKKASPAGPNEMLNEKMYEILQREKVINKKEKEMKEISAKIKKEKEELLEREKRLVADTKDHDHKKKNSNADLVESRRIVARRKKRLKKEAARQKRIEKLMKQQQEKRQGEIESSEDDFVMLNTIEDGEKPKKKKQKKKKKRRRIFKKPVRSSSSGESSTDEEEKTEKKKTRKKKTRKKKTRKKKTRKKKIRKKKIEELTDSEDKPYVPRSAEFQTAKQKIDSNQRKRTRNELNGSIALKKVTKIEHNAKEPVKKKFKDSEGKSSELSQYQTCQSCYQVESKDVMIHCFGCNGFVHIIKPQQCSRRCLVERTVADGDDGKRKKVVCCHNCCNK